VIEDGAPASGRVTIDDANGRQGTRRVSVYTLAFLFFIF